MILRFLGKLFRRKPQTQPETHYAVTMEGDVITSRHSNGETQQIAFADIRKVMVATNDGGPWGIDFWWILEGEVAESRVTFPLGAPGEKGVSDKLVNLPGFESMGSDSADNALSSVALNHDGWFESGSFIPI